MSAPKELSPGLWEWNLEAFPERAAISPGGEQAAFALGDGRVALVDLPDQQARFALAHEGSALGVVAHPGRGFVSAGDDGALMRVGPDGQVSEILRQPGLWLEPLAASLDSTIVAVGAGKNALMADMVSGVVRSLGPHDAVVSGLAVSPAGGVLAVGYSGGVTLWDLGEAREPAHIRWPGGNRAMAFSPNGSYLACANQDSAVHVLDLEEQNVFTLAGLPANSAQLVWTGDSKYLCTTGARGVLLWPVPQCFTDNPTPVVAAAQEDARVTALAANPAIPFVAAGFDDGRIVLIEYNRLAVLDLDHLPTSPVTSLAWSANGLRLVCAMEEGRVLALDLATLLAHD